MSDIEGSARASPPAGPTPDPHGQAALILVESVLHVLVEASALSLDQALGAVSTACVVKREFAEQAGEPASCMQQSLDLLNDIAASLAIDAR